MCAWAHGFSLFSPRVAPETYNLSRSDGRALQAPLCVPTGAGRPNMNNERKRAYDNQQATTNETRQQVGGRPLKMQKCSKCNETRKGRTCLFNVV